MVGAMIDTIKVHDGPAASPRSRGLFARTVLANTYWVVQPRRSGAFQLRPFLVKAFVGYSEDSHNHVLLYVAIFAIPAEAMGAVQKEVPKYWRVSSVSDTNGESQTSRQVDVEKLCLWPRQVALID